MKFLFLSFFIVFGIVFGTELKANQVVDIGIISFRDLSQNQKEWQSLENSLNNYNGKYQYKIHSYTQKDLEKAVEQNELELLIVHPLEAVTMETKYHTHTIASIEKKDSVGNLLTEYGSVLVTKSNKEDINTLKDLKHKKIAVSHKDGFASYLIAKDLLYNEVGLDMDIDCRVVVTGQPMDKVWNALKNDEADVGVFRTGYIEELIGKGKLSLSEIKVIHPQKVDNFPYLLSSKLYPEWAVVMTDNLEKDAIKDIVIAFYRLKEDNSSEYSSFSIPSSYASTKEMMQKYHIYPFERIDFSFATFVKEYFFLISLVMTSILFLSWYFVYYYLKTSRKLKEDAEQFATIFATASDGIHIHDSDGNLLFFSDSFHNMLGYTREEMSKLTLFDFEKNLDSEQLEKNTYEIIKNHKTLRFETKHQKKDGTPLDVEVIIRSITLDKKPYIYSVSRDVTELKHQRRLLEVQKEEFETIFETSQDGLVVIDLDSNFIKVNNAYAQITGLSKEELLQTSAIALTSSENEEKLREIYLTVKQNGYVDSFEKVYTVKGKQITVSVSLALMPDKEHILANVKNISHLKQFEAQSKLASMGEMIGNIAHQWRQPLTVISSLASGIEFRNDNNLLKEYENTSHDMETIMVQTNYLSHTIEDFRDFIRGDLSISEVHIKKVVEKTLLIVGATMRKNDIVIVKNEDDFSFNGYENEMVQAFINILNNAKDALKEHFGIEDDKYIFITINSDGRFVEIIDNGGGIPEEIMPRIFESYFTTKHKDIGTGIGLAMTHQIIAEHHRATIDVSNKEYSYNEKEYRGACFKITFLG